MKEEFIKAYSILFLEAKSLKEASFKLSNQKFDLILIDQDINNLKVYEFIKDLIDNKYYRGQDFLLLSSQLTQSDLIELAKLKLKKVLLKPIDFNHLATLIK